MTAGELLREARLRHGLTQKQLAIRAGSTQSAISRIERGHVSPTVETLEALLHQMNEELILGTQEVDWGFDRTLYDVTLARSVEQRIRDAGAWATFVLRNRGIARGAD
jgi:transcriptional regulator with XRE-family HTH domain